MDNISVQSKWIDQISILEISGEITDPVPLVFFTHGFESDKRDGIRLGYELASRGIIAVCLDTILKGARTQQIFDPSIGEIVKDVYPSATGMDGFLNMIKMIRQTGNDLKTLIEYFRQDPRVDPDRIGLAGYSMGGWATFYGAGFVPEIKVAAAIAGIPAFEDCWSDLILECSSTQEWSRAMAGLKGETEKWTAYIRDMDPFQQLSAFPPKPLLMVCGAADAVVPKKYSLDLYRSLKPLYKEQPSNIKLSIYDDIDHQFIPAMMTEVAVWFESKLG